MKTLSTTSTGYTVTFGARTLDLDFDNPLEMLVVDLAYEFDRTFEQLTSQIAQVRDQATRALASLSAGQSVNSLGVFQSSAPSADRLSAELAVAATALARGMSAVERSRESESTTN